MEIGIAVVGVMFGVAGVSGVVAPKAMMNALDDFKSSPVKIYGWAGIRVLIGLVLVVGASGTAVPTLVRLIGAVLILKAALVPVLGLHRVRSLLGWLQVRPPLLVRLLFLLVVSFGAFLVWIVIQP